MYRIFNIALDSQIPIPELSQALDSQTAATYTFSLFADKVIDDSDIDWFHDWPGPDESIILSAGRDEKHDWLRFPQLVDFKISRDDLTITAYSHAGNSESTVRHLLLDQVVPRLLGQHGHLILHSGAVTLANGKTIAFIGQSGWGKSTLVSSFQQQGAELISDDCLMIVPADERVLAIPNYFGIRLFDDSIDAIFGQQQEYGDVAHYSSKRRLIMSGRIQNEVTAPLQLDAIFLLSDPEEDRVSGQINITRTGGMDAMMTMVAQTFVLDVTDTQLMAEQFRHCGRLFDVEIPIYALDYPRNHNKLFEVRQEIEAKLGEED